jgi:hypothetical protein
MIREMFGGSIGNVSKPSKKVINVYIHILITLGAKPKEKRFIGDAVWSGKALWR